MLFTALTSVAFILDIYFEKHPVQFDELKDRKKETADYQSVFFYWNPFNSLSLKLSAQKISPRFHFEQLHNKFVQKYHQHDKSVELKKEAERIKNRPELTYLRLIFKNYYFTYSDDDIPVTIS